jgi:hypothetical protein
MKINIDGKSIFILILILILVASVIFNRDIARLIGQEREVVQELVEVEKELSQGIKDSLELIPVYEARIDSLKLALDYNSQQIIFIEKEYDSLKMVIDKNTVTEDMQFFAEYMDIDTIPILLRIDNNPGVVITPLQLKRTNFIFLSHDSYAKKYPLMESRISTLTNITTEQDGEITLLKNTIGIYDQRYAINKDIILRKDEIIKLQKKQKRRRTWGMIGAGVVGFAAGVLIFK